MIREVNLPAILNINLLRSISLLYAELIHNMLTLVRKFVCKLGLHTLVAAAFLNSILKTDYLTRQLTE